MLRTAITDMVSRGLLDGGTVQDQDPELFYLPSRLLMARCALDSRRTRTSDGPAISLPGARCLLTSKTCPPELLEVFTQWSSTATRIDALRLSDSEVAVFERFVAERETTVPHDAWIPLRNDLAAISIAITQKQQFNRDFSDDLRAVEAAVNSILSSKQTEPAPGCESLNSKMLLSRIKETLFGELFTSCIELAGRGNFTLLQATCDMLVRFLSDAAVFDAQGHACGYNLVVIGNRTENLTEVNCPEHLRGFVRKFFELSNVFRHTCHGAEKRAALLQSIVAVSASASKGRSPGDGVSTLGGPQQLDVSILQLASVLVRHPLYVQRWQQLKDSGVLPAMPTDGAE